MWDTLVRYTLNDEQIAEIWELPRGLDKGHLMSTSLGVMVVKEIYFFKYPIMMNADNGFKLIAREVIFEFTK